MRFALSQAPAKEHCLLAGEKPEATNKPVSIVEANLTSLWSGCRKACLEKE